MIGGLDDASRVLKTVQVYTPSNNSWRTLAPLPTAGMTLGAGAINGKIYVVGGYGTGSTYLSNTQVYIP